MITELLTEILEVQRGLHRDPENPELRRRHEEIYRELVRIGYTSGPYLGPVSCAH